MDQSRNNSQNTHKTRTSRGHKRRVNKQEGLDSATANIGTSGFHTQVQVRDSQSPHAAIPPESGASVDVMQSNAYFQNAHGVNVSGNPSFQNQNIGSVTNIYGGGKDGLEWLTGFISFDAQFDSSAQDPDRQCHPGTRQNVLKRLRDWVDNPKSTERIFWLYGPAGAGKSAIAQTIAGSYNRPKVAGTFFFFRSDVNRNDGNRLFTTLAYQIALSMPEIRDYISHTLSERPDLPRTDVKTQFKQLLARPFHALSDGATQQLGPAVIVDIIKKYHELAPVIIIDGVDECIDENIQRQFLNIISDTVKDDRFPLRFLIVSRPEAHIEQTIRRFQTPILTIDLAELDDANRDIEKYLKDEFSRIASEQGLEPTWPSQENIDDIVYKSSGNFIFASLVIKFVGDSYCFAKTQLEIVLNMKPPKTMSPFAILDQLFLEILGRVPDQEFLKKYLALLVARISVDSSDYGKLHEDDAVLMHVSIQELHANLRRMRSLLKFDPFIDVHHKSFLDFLHDSSRSGQYYLRKPGGIKGYLSLFVDSLVRYVSAVVEQPNFHKTTHFTPRFRELLKWYPPKIELSFQEWQEVTQPLFDLQDKLLQLPTSPFPLDILPCDECTAFHLLRELLQIGLHLGFNPDASVGKASVRNLRKLRDTTSSIPTKVKKNANDNDLDGILLSLFSQLPKTLENGSHNKKLINLMSKVLCFDFSETLMRVCSISDAQKLVDLLDYVIHAKNALRPGAMRKASLLAFKIFARVPIVPLSYVLKGDHDSYRYQSTSTIHIEIFSQTIFASRILDHHYINPLLGNVAFDRNIPLEVGNDLHLRRWVFLNSATKIKMMLQLAKTIQYLHSMDVVLVRDFHSVNAFLDLDLYPRIRCWYSTSQSLLARECRERFLPYDSIFSFGALCYELYVGADTWSDYKISSARRVIPKRLSKIPEIVWQLIQRCYAEDSKYRPTIDEVVKEIESWHDVGDVEPDEVENGNQVQDGVGHEEPDEVENGMQVRDGVGHEEPAEVENGMQVQDGVGHEEPDEVANGMQVQDDVGDVEPSCQDASACFGALCSFLSNLGRSLCQ